MNFDLGARMGESLEALNLGELVFELVLAVELLLEFRGRVLFSVLIYSTI
jgi:hypothetical protein